MVKRMSSNRFLWLALGVIVGSLSSGILPQAPLYGSATHGQEGFAICTGPLTDSIEGVYVLDYLTGELRGAGLSIFGKFTSTYQYNILKDFEASKSPKFLMVTGVADLRPTGQKLKMGRSVVYVAEVNSGFVAAYGVPFDPSAQSQGRGVSASFIPLDAAKFRDVKIRPE